MMMMTAKLGWAGPGAKQERGRSMRRAGQEQGRSRAEQSWAGTGCNLKYSQVLLCALKDSKYLSTYVASTQILLSTLKYS